MRYAGMIDREALADGMLLPVSMMGHIAAIGMSKATRARIRILRDRDARIVGGTDEARSLCGVPIEADHMADDELVLKLKNGSHVYIAITKAEP